MPTGVYIRKKRGIYNGEKPKFKIKCGLCGNNYFAKRKTRRFCSTFCAYRSRYVLKGRKKGNFEKCGFCLKDVWVMPYRKKARKIFYCNRKCQIFYQKSIAFNFPCKICGKAIFTQPAQLKLRARSTCSLGCRRKLSRKRAEERRVKFGYTKHQLDRLARYSIEAKSWRKRVFERDNYTCQICKVRGTYLEADHIKPFAYFPELRYELSNGRTLCRPCHNKTKMSYYKMRKLYA